MRNPPRIDVRITTARKLVILADELRNGRSFPITRLTVLKRLCADPRDAAVFARYLAELAQSRFRQAPPARLDTDRVREFGVLMGITVDCMGRYVATPARDAELELRAALRALAAAQSKTRDTRWATVRTIDSREALIVEYAAHCILEPKDASAWGYRLGREHAERYDPRHGTGLVPESAPYVREIADFWLSAPPNIPHPSR
ncbi:hypothetical protein [Longimicrobium sp.]|uniref:hypothetical protein n=1 Tax=Longimicrobium sp. TaxID=2029185 RepID=UPI003B3A7B14